MERPLITAAVSYLIGLVLGEAFTYFPLTVLGLGMIAMGMAYLDHRQQHGSRWVLFLITGLVFFGMIRMQIATRVHSPDDLARFATREQVQVVAVIDGPPQHGPESTVLTLKTRSVTVDGQEHPAEGRLRLTLREFMSDLKYGDRIRIRAKLRPPSGMQNPGGFDYGAYLQREGIRAVAALRRPEAVAWIAADGFAPLRWIYDGRERIRQALESSLSPVSAAILKAMLIGETLSLSPEIREAFMISGTTHLLSISGTHLAMVAWVVFQLSQWVLRQMPGRWLLSFSRRMTVTRMSILVTLVPVIFYTLLAGGQVATVRSLIMILIYLAVLWWQGTSDSLNALAIAALIVLLWDPLAIFSISFQLSYIAVLAMVFIGCRKAVPVTGRDQSVQEDGTSWAGHLFEKVRAIFWVTAAAGGATLPLTAYYFNQIAWVGFLSNLIVVPLVGLIIVPLGLACAVGAVLFHQTHLPLAGLNDGLAGGLFWMVQGFARFPGSEVHVPSPPVVVVAALYIAALVALVYYRRAGVRKWLWISLCLLMVVIWGLRFALFHPQGLLRVAFLDVGQGDAAWIQMPDGKTMLIDGGSAYGDFDIGRLVVAPYLWNTGHWRIDTLVATHPQLDHMGGLSYIARKFRVGEVWTNGRGKDALFYDRFKKVVLAKAIPERQIVGHGLPLFQQGALQILPLHPVPPPDALSDSSNRVSAGRSAASDNNQSLVIRIQYGQDVILFTGDIERLAQRELLRWGNRLQATVLKVPHHGSRTSIDPDFLSQVNPSVAVISVGGNNPYRHPSPETIAAYGALGARIYRTDRDGAVLLQTDGRQRTVRTYHESTPVPVLWGEGMAAREASNLARVFHRYWFGLL